MHTYRQTKREREAQEYTDGQTERQRGMKLHRRADRKTGIQTEKLRGIQAYIRTDKDRRNIRTDRKTEGHTGIHME